VPRLHRVIFMSTTPSFQKPFKPFRLLTPEELECLFQGITLSYEVLWNIPHSCPDCNYPLVCAKHIDEDIFSSEECPEEERK